jgi:hypothetical protein
VIATKETGRGKVMSVVATAAGNCVPVAWDDCGYLLTKYGGGVLRCKWLTQNSAFLRVFGLGRLAIPVWS